MALSSSESLPPRLCEPFKTRQTPFGLSGCIRYERGLLGVDNWLWVLLREARQPRQCPVLPRNIELVANAVHQELVLLRGLPDRLRFFHLFYEAGRGGQPRWTLREVLFIRQNGWYALGSWVQVRPETWERFNAAWSLEAQPPRRLP